MNIIIHAVNFPMAKNIRRAVEKRLRFSMRRYGDNLQKLVIRLWHDDNHADKRCQLQVRICGQEDIIIDQRDRNLHAAIYHSVERASNTILRRLKRQQAKNRQRQVMPLPTR